MTRVSLAIWTTVLFLCVSGDLRLMVRDAIVAGAIPAAAADACGYYKQRAGAHPMHTPVRLETMLSESCVVAMRSLRGTSQEERVAAAVYLTRISELHRAIAEMNARRYAAVPAYNGGAQGAGRVTPAGEFLIAHRIGVIRAFEAWLDTGADFSLASYR
jgi:hypothetical protein